MAVALAFLFLLGHAGAGRLVLGGRYGWPGKITAFDVTPKGSLQLREYKPYQNILQMLDKRDDEGVLWYSYWHIDTRVDYDKLCGLPDELKGYVEGEDPRVWDPATHPEFLDGDPVSADTRAISKMRAPKRYHNIFDTGVPVRVNRLVFYPKWSGEIITKGNWYEGSPFYDSYMRQYVASASLYNEPPLRPGLYPKPLDVILKEERENYDRVVEVEFPLQPLRFFLLDHTGEFGYTLGEIELYGEGFSPEAWYTSKIIDLGGPKNFGRVFFDFKKFRWRKEWRWKGARHMEGYSELDLGRKSIEELWEEVLVDPVPFEDPEAPVRLEVRVRTGKDDSPLIYYKIDDMLNERGEVVTREEYLSLPSRPMEFTRTSRPEVGMRGVIEPDRENWSLWTFVPASGRKVGIPDVRRYIQFQVKMYSDDPWAFGRLDSIWIEISPPLADEVLGEVCLEGNPEGPNEVEVGVDTSFVYAIKAYAPGRSGVFDALRISTPVRPKFEKLSIGGVEVEPEDFLVGDGYLEVFLPKKAGHDEPVEVKFRTAVLSYATSFLARVWDRESDLLPQAVVPGDAVAWIKTNQIQVFGLARSLQVLKDFGVEPRVVTPDGSGPDSTWVVYTISLVAEGAEVDVGVYDVAGRKVRTLKHEESGSTFEERVGWDGRDDEGNLVLPGVYLLGVRVRTDRGESARFSPVVVVY